MKMKNKKPKHDPNRLLKVRANTFSWALDFDDGRIKVEAGTLEGVILKFAGELLAYKDEREQKEICDAIRTAAREL